MIDLDVILFIFFSNVIVKTILIVKRIVLEKKIILDNKKT